MVCVSRDVSEFAKNLITDRLSADLAGTFVRVNTTRNYGVDIPAIQKVSA